MNETPTMKQLWDMYAELSGYERADAYWRMTETHAEQIARLAGIEGPPDSFEDATLFGMPIKIDEDADQVYLRVPEPRGWNQ